MTDPLTHRSFTIRLTPDDQVVLAALCALYGLDRPDSLRRAIRQVLAAEQPALPSSGYFHPIGAATLDPFPIHIAPMEDHESAK